MSPRLSDGTPFVAVANSELGEPIGNEITCPHCGNQHTVHDSEPSRRLDSVSGRWVAGESGLLQFYKCGDKAYLAGIRGRRWQPGPGVTVNAP